MLLRLTLIAALLVMFLSAALVTTAAAVAAAFPRTELAFVGFETGDADIFVYDAAHGLRHNLTANPAYDLSPVWSPDGNQIAFVSDRDGGLQIFVMDASGGDVRRLTPDGLAFEYPRWTADGERLVLMARGETLPDLFIVNADGSGFELIAEQSWDTRDVMMELGINMQPLTDPLSPAGSGYLTVALTGGDWGLFLSRNEGEHSDLLASLGRLQGRNSPVSWSPDGQHIAFVSSMDGQVDLYLIAAEPGAQPLRLTNDRANEISPVWRP